MSTDQKYNSGVSSPNFLDLTAKRPVNQTHCESTGSMLSVAETFRRNFLKREHEVAVLEATQTPVIDDDESLTELISRFVSELPSSENISVLCELEQAWAGRRAGTKKKAAPSDWYYDHIRFNALRIATFLAALHTKWNAATTYELELAESICNNAEGELSHAE